MKSFGNSLMGVVVALLLFAAAAPALIRLGHALVLPVIVIAVALIACRVVWFSTRRF